MVRRYVIDTCCLINYFGDVFHERPKLSRYVRRLLDQAFSRSPEVILSIPAISFVEVFDTHQRNEEFARRFHYEVYTRIEQCENIEIKPIDDEVLENLVKLRGCLAVHDLHDKLILACAMTLECPLITWDPAIVSLVNATPGLPGALS